MYQNYQYPYQSNMKNNNMVTYTNNNGDRFAGGFLGPFLLGGITGGVVAPYFWGGNNRPNYNNYYYQPYPPYYGPYYYR